MSQTHIKTFINKNINLDEERYKKIIEKYKATKELLEKSGKFVKISRQGSVATKTSIKPKNPEHEYDLDIAVQISDNNFIIKKNELENILEENFGDRVSRKAKCVNVIWNKEFNADYVIMKNTNNSQSIFDESKNHEIKSDNLNLMDDINDVFSSAINDSLRDCAKLLKFYLRQHLKTNELIPSIAQNLLICSNYASSKLGYIGQITTTLSNIAHSIDEMIKSNKLLTSIKNPSNDSEINLSIKNFDDMKNIALVISDLKKDIENSELRALNIDSEIRSKNLDSSLTEKPYGKNNRIS